jgi:hypothetical protein
MRLSKDGWTIPVTVLAVGIAAAKLSTHLGVPARREDEIILTVALTGAMFFSYPKLWSMGVFWVLLFTCLGVHILVLWVLFDLCFPKLVRMVILVAVVEVFCVQYLLNRCRLRFIAEHRSYQSW